MKQKLSVAEAPAKEAVPAHTRYSVRVMDSGVGDGATSLSAKALELLAAELGEDDDVLTTDKSYTITVDLQVTLDT